MSVLYTPRKPKLTRLHKSIPRGRRRPQRIRPAGSMGNVYATGFGSLSWRRLEAGRRLLTRQLRRSKVRVRSRLTQPLTAKSKHARMGKGKGKLRGWSGYVRPGTLMYVLEPTPRKSWLKHRSPTTRLLGLFPFGRLNYKYSGGLAAVQRSGLRRRVAQNRRSRAHYPQRAPGIYWPPAHRRRRDRSTAAAETGTPWQTQLPLAQGLGLWLARWDSYGGGVLQRQSAPLLSLLSSSPELLEGYLEGRRRLGRKPLAGEYRLRRQLQRLQHHHRRRQRQRLLRKLLKRLPQRWRRRRQALGGLLEGCWRLLQRRRRSAAAADPSLGLLITLQSLTLLLQRLQRLQQCSEASTAEEAVPLRPEAQLPSLPWPPLSEESLYQRRRTLERLQRHHLPLTNYHPTTKPLDLEPSPGSRPQELTPGQRRRWRRHVWLINWYNQKLRRETAFPTDLRNRRLRRSDTIDRRSPTDSGFPNPTDNFPITPLEEEEEEEEEEEGEEKEEKEEEVSEEPLNSEGLLQRELLQQLWVQEENYPFATAIPATTAAAAAALPATPPTGALLAQRARSMATNPQYWTALQRRLLQPSSRRRLEEQRRWSGAAGRVGQWLRSGGGPSRRLQLQQWKQRLVRWGLELHWGPRGLVLGSPSGGSLALHWLLPLLRRLRRRCAALRRHDRRRQRRGKRLQRRQKRRQRSKARRRRFWRLTHRRRWSWWHRRQRRRNWRWSLRLGSGA